MLTVAGLLLQLLATGCFVVVLAHAFGRSLRAGALVLLVPPYALFYGFSRFAHRRRDLVLAGWLLGLALAVVFRLAARSP